MRDDVKTPGYFVFAPARLPDGRIVVINRGYSAQPDAKPVTRQRSRSSAILRFPETGSLFVPDHDAAGNTWFVRDQRAMAKTLGWGEVAPFYIDQESPVPAGGVPKPGPLKVQLQQRPSRLCADLVRAGGGARRRFRGLGLARSGRKRPEKPSRPSLPCESPPTHYSLALRHFPP